MLKNFNNLSGLFPVFLESNNYYCDIHGNLFDSRKELIKLDRDQEGNLGKFISIWNHAKFYKIGVLVASVFKSVKIDKSLLHLLDILHLDGNKENNHASNLIWKFPKGGLRHPRYKEFAYIPGYSSYIISKDGILMNHKEDKITRPFYEEGYAKVRIQPDVGFRKQVGIHRLVALAWLEYPAYVDSLIVNHKNGIPGTDFVDNLEFITRNENNLHASSNGLLTKGREILVKNYETGDVMSFSGTTSCAKYFGLNRSTIKYRLHSGQQIYPGNLVFKYAYDQRPWREDLVLTDRELNEGSSESIKAKNIFTGEVSHFDSIKQASNVLNIPITTIHSQLKISKSKRPTHNYLFKYESDDSDWTNYTEDELNVFRKYPKGKQLGIKVRNKKTDEIIIFTDKEHLMSYFKISFNELKKFKMGKGILSDTFKYVNTLESLNPFN